MGDITSFNRMRRLEAEKVAAENETAKDDSTSSLISEEVYTAMVANKASIVAALTEYGLDHNPKDTVPVLRAQLDAYLKEKGMIE